MSFRGFRVVMPVPASVVDEVAPVLALPIETRRTSGSARRAMERWAGGARMPSTCRSCTPWPPPT
ncbi:hypothetical protein [Kitasatospora purpeofusca]|uniref:hypothetical protein n=1 Tax=Kitasatospora purpeofusca TaxID=67352 RepID=UPI003651B192